MAQRRMTTPKIVCELKAWQWQVEGYVIAGTIHNPRDSHYTEGVVKEFNFDAVSQYPASFDGEAPYYLGRMINGNYVKFYLEEEGCGDPLKSLFGGKLPDKGGSK